MKRIVKRSLPGRWIVIAVEGDWVTVGKPHPTHEAALAHALAAVGLDRPAEHREAP